MDKFSFASAGQHFSSLCVGRMVCTRHRTMHVVSLLSRTLCEDFIIGFETESDARRVMEVLLRRFSRFFKVIWQWCRLNRQESLEQQHKILCIKPRGHYQYYAANYNSEALDEVRHHTCRSWQYWLSWRNHKKILRWDHFEELISKKFQLPRPWILHQI